MRFDRVVAVREAGKLKVSLTGFLKFVGATGFKRLAWQKARGSAFKKFRRAVVAGNPRNPSSGSSRLLVRHFRGLPMQIMVANSGVFSFVTVAVTAAERDSESATVELPFDFMVGDKVLRAGIYSVRDSHIPGLLLFHGQRSAGEPILVHTINNNSPESAIPEKLLFLVQQNTYYLGQALMAAV